MTDNSNLSRRRFLQATGGAATAVALAGCTDNGDGSDQETTTGGTDTTTEETTTGGDSPSGKTLRRTNATIRSLDPIQSSATSGGRVIQNMFDALLNYPNGEVEVENLLVTDYETSEDFKTYTFSLKKGVKFHNGKELTASDVVYSYERLASSPNSQRAFFILDYGLGTVHEQDSEGNYKPDTLGVNAVDDYTFEITLKEPFHAALTVMAYSSFSIIPEGMVDDVPAYDGGEVSAEEFGTSKAVGAGPFQLEKWQPNTEVEVTRFDDYHGDVAKIAGVHWQIIEDPTALYNYAMNKNADAFGLPTPKYDPNKVTVEETDDKGRKSGKYGPVRNGENVNYLGVATINTYYIAFNAKNVEKPVRQAVAHAMNQQTMVDQVFKGRGTPAYHFTPPNIYPGSGSAYNKHAEESYPYGYNQDQLDQARQIMEDAGYGENNRYEFTFTTYVSDTWQQMGGILRDQLASCYIDMKLEETEFATIQNRGMKGNLEAYSLGWIMDWPTPDNFLGLLYPPMTDTSKEAPQAYTDWTGTDAADRATKAWEKVKANPAPTDDAQSKREEAYVEIEEANWEDVIFLNVYHGLEEMFWYDWLDIPKFGGGGGSRQKLNTVTIGDRN